MRYTLALSENNRGIIDWDFDGKETMLFAIGGISEGRDETRILIREVITPDDSQYVTRGACGATVRAEFMFDCYKKCPDMGLSLFICSHSHPEKAFVSRRDDRNTEAHLKVIKDFNISWYVSIITGCDGVVSYAYHMVDGRWQQENIDHIIVYKVNGMELVVTKNSESHPDISIDAEIHNRTLQIGGGIKQTLEMLSFTKTAIIGVGGIGNMVAHIIKHLGVRHIALVDPDVLDKSNANRFFGYTSGDCGKLKVDVTKRELLSFNPDMQVETYPERYPSEDTRMALKSCHLVIATPDNHYARRQVSDDCAKYLLPLFSGGAGIYAEETGRPYRISCSVLFQLPIPLGPCLGCLGVKAELPPQYEEMVTAAKRSYIKGFRDPGPTPASVITLHAQCANMLVRHIIYYLSEISDKPVPLHLVYDEIPIEQAFQDLTSLFPGRDDCPVCGTGDWAYGDSALSIPRKDELEMKAEGSFCDERE